MKKSSTSITRYPIAFRRLSASNAEDVRELQKLFESSQSYFLLEQGRLATPQAAYTVLTNVIFGKTQDDMFVWALLHEDQMIGCSVMVRGHPASEIAYIRLHIIAENYRGKGFGSAALDQLDALAASWGCSTLQLSVIANNKKAISFWRRQGFCALSRKAIPGFSDEAIIMQRSCISLPLPATA